MPLGADNNTVGSGLITVSRLITIVKTTVVGEEDLDFMIITVMIYCTKG